MRWRGAGIGPCLLEHEQAQSRCPRHCLYCCSCDGCNQPAAAAGHTIPLIFVITFWRAWLLVCCLLSCCHHFNQ